VDEPGVVGVDGAVVSVAQHSLTILINAS
jgi:hypothetical protein